MMMNTPLSAADRAAYHSLKTYWVERIAYLPTPYQFLAWLKLWHIDALKEAVRCTARWVKRQMERGEEIDSDDLIRYFSATARNIHSAKEAAESLEVPNE
jgi:hypothetical protein